MRTSKSGLIILVNLYVTVYDYSTYTAIKINNGRYYNLV